MNKLYIGIVLLLACVGCSNKLSPESSSQSVRDHIRNQIDKIIRYDIEWDEEVVPGFMIAMVDGDSSWYYSYGRYPDTRDSIRLTEGFYLGGLGLAILSRQLGDEIRSGRLVAENTIGDYLAEYNALAVGSLSIAELMNHRAGLPKIPPGRARIEKNPAQPYAEWNYEEADNSLKMIEELGSEWRYSPLNYYLLERLYQRLDPAAHAAWIARWNTRVQKYGRKRSSKMGRPAALGAMQPLLGRSTDLHQLTTWMRGLWQRYTLDPIDTEHDHIMHDGTGYLTDNKKAILWSHAGQMEGIKVSVLAVPKTETAVIAVYYGEEGIDDLALLILRMMNDNWRRID